MQTPQQLLLNNRAWVKDKLQVDENFFSKTASSSNPKILWIGCSDSRVPAEEITGALSGELIVHRNVGNIVVSSDVSANSVILIALEVAQVRHIIICGHYGCNAVDHALDSTRTGVLEYWLEHIRDVYHLHAEELNKIADPAKRSERMAELNVIEQVRHVSSLDAVKRLQDTESELTIHGWIYNIYTGLLTSIVTNEPGHNK